MTNTGLAQFLGMVKYEFKMHWRRRAMWVITLAMIVITILIGQIGKTTLQAPMTALAESVGQGGLKSSEILTYGILFMTWTPLAAMLAIILPIVVADTIPLDRQTGVHELLDSYPLSHNLYYMGKLVGMWVAVLGGIAAATVFDSVFWFVTTGAYDLLPYLATFLFGGATLVILNGSIGVIIAAAQPNRQRAVLTVLLVYVLPYLMVVSDTQELGSKVTALTYLNPLRGPIVGRYTNLSLPQLNFFTPEVMIAIVVGIIELMVLAILVYGWMHWQELRVRG